jgi:hypothetical protein
VSVFVLPEPNNPLIPFALLHFAKKSVPHENGTPFFMREARKSHA